MKLQPGQYIRHAKYGCGTIIARDDDRTTVDFDTAGLKLFVTSLAAFEPAEGASPKKRGLAARRRTKASSL
jgi:hypothetical protein